MNAANIVRMDVIVIKVLSAI